MVLHYLRTGSCLVLVLPTPCLHGHAGNPSIWRPLLHSIFFFFAVQLIYNVVVPFYFKEYFFSKKKEARTRRMEGGKKKRREQRERCHYRLSTGKRKTPGFDSF